MRAFLIITFSLFFRIGFAEQLEAVLILGSNLPDTTRKSHLGELNDIESFLGSKNVIVHKFYDSEAKWDNIIKVTPRCKFFIYFGHGGMKNFIYIGGVLIDSNKIISDLRLKPNSIILLGHCCFSAGSSSDDKGPISLKTARDRVHSRYSVYSKTGASVYYSNNFYMKVLSFLAGLYNGNSIAEYTKNFVEKDGLYNDPDLSMEEHIEDNYKGNVYVLLYSDETDDNDNGYYDMCIIGDPGFKLF